MRNYKKAGYLIVNSQRKECKHRANLFISQNTQTHTYIRVYIQKSPCRDENQPHCDMNTMICPSLC